MSAAEAILEYVSNNPSSDTNDITEALTPMWSKETIRNVLFALKREGKLQSTTEYRPAAKWTLA